MRKAVIAAGLVLLIATGGWLALGGGARHKAEEPRSREPHTPVAVMEADRPAAAAEPAAKVEPAFAPSRRGVSKQERDELRRRILAAMQAREAAAAERDGAAGEGEPRREGKAGELVPPRGEPRRPDDETPTPGNLTDRTGNHGHMVKVMNEELMPLVDECYALAHETQPGLMSMLVLDVEMIGDEELGGVVESVNVGQGNEVADPALIECVQESLLGITLPPPPEGGREALQLQLRPDEPAEG
jgi:hypothetical protein